MRPAFLPIVAFLGISGCAFGQSASSDTQTLQALLNEVRALRQDLRVSLNRTQATQILLARFQIQEGAITRASDRLNEARQKLLDTHVHQKELTLGVKRLEDALSAAENSEQRTALEDRIKHVKSDLEVTGNIAQQQQTTEIQAEQHLREEQDQLNALESRLDELIGTASNSNEKSNANRP
jgi:hypothetical protein